MIKIDTVTITNAIWYKELSAMTNGVSVPFRTGGKTARLVEASVNSRGSKFSRAKFRANKIMLEEVDDLELRAIYDAYEDECNSE